MIKTIMIVAFEIAMASAACAQDRWEITAYPRVPTEESLYSPSAWQSRQWDEFERHQSECNNTCGNYVAPIPSYEQPHPYQMAPLP